MKKIFSIVLVVVLVVTSVVFVPSSAYAKGKVKSLKLSKTKMSLQVGESDSAKVTIKVKKKMSKAFKVKTSNAKIVTVKKKGKKVVVTGVGAGTAKVTVTSKANKKKKKVIKVNVTKPTPADIAMNLTQLNGYTFELAFAKKVNLSTSSIKVETKEYSDGKYNHVVLIRNVTSRDGVIYFVTLKEEIVKKRIVKFTVSGINKTPIVKEMSSYMFEGKYNLSTESVYTAKIGESFNTIFSSQNYIDASGFVSISVSDLPSGLTSTLKNKSVIIEGKPNKVGVQKAKVVFTDEKGMTYTIFLVLVVGSERKLVTYAPDAELYVNHDGYIRQGVSNFVVAGGSGSYKINVESRSSVYFERPDRVFAGSYHWYFEANTPGNYEGIVKVVDSMDPELYTTVTTRAKSIYGIEVSGTVKTKTGKKVDGVCIESFVEEQVNNWGEFQYAGVTDENGEYTLILPKGKYTIQADLNGEYDFERHKTISKDCTVDFTLDLYQLKLTSDDPDFNLSENYSWIEDDMNYNSHNYTIFLSKGKHRLVSCFDLLCKELIIDTNVVGDETLKVEVKNLTLDLGKNDIEILNDIGQSYSFTPSVDGEYSYDVQLGYSVWLSRLEVFDEDGLKIDIEGGYTTHFRNTIYLEAGITYKLRFIVKGYPTDGSITLEKTN